MKKSFFTFLIATICIIASSSVTAKPKSNPFNEEGPQCIGIKCLTEGSGFIKELIGKSDKKPPFNDEGPGGKKGKNKSA
jgi:hypothetical protein